MLYWISLLLFGMAVSPLLYFSLWHYYKPVGGAMYERNVNNAEKIEKSENVMECKVVYVVKWYRQKWVYRSPDGLRDAGCGKPCTRMTGRIPSGMCLFCADFEQSTTGAAIHVSTACKYASFRAAYRLPPMVLTIITRGEVRIWQT
jgi:hypothetical protein